MKKEVENLDELHAMNLFFPSAYDVQVENTLAKHLEERNIPVTDFARLVGISRQALNMAINETVAPDLVNAMKMAYILDVPVEELFKLANFAWVERAKDANKKTIYFDHFTNTVRSGKDMKGTDRSERLDLKKNQLITEDEYKKFLKEARETAAKNYLSQNPEDTRRDAVAEAKKEAENIIESLYPRRYSVLYRKTTAVKLSR